MTTGQDVTVLSRVAVARLANDDGDAVLFGAEDDARVHYGALEEANGGTLFLDDIADLPPHLQTRLYGALESRRSHALAARSPYRWMRGSSSRLPKTSPRQSTKASFAMICIT